MQQTHIFQQKGHGLEKIGINLWKSLTTFNELTEVIRSKNDNSFTDLNQRLRVGKHTADDMKTLMSRVMDKLPHITELINSMLLFDKIKSVTKHDMESYMKKNVAFKRDELKVKKHLKTRPASQTAGLPKSLMLGIGCRVMVRVNLETNKKN